MGDEEDEEAMMIKSNANNSKRALRYTQDDDQTTQYSVQASILTQNMIPHDTCSEYSYVVGANGGVIDHTDSVSQIGKSGQNPQLHTLKK